MRDGDIIADVLGRAAAVIRTLLAAQGVTAELIDETCRKVVEQEHPARIHWGGDFLYIPKKPDNRDALRRALDEARRTGRIADPIRRRR